MIEVELPDGRILEVDAADPAAAAAAARAFMQRGQQPAAPAAPAPAPTPTALPGGPPDISAQARINAGVDGLQPGAPQPVAEPLPPALARGTQAVGSGLRKLAFGLPDLAAGATNVAIAGADKASQVLGGPSIDFRFGQPSEAFASQVAVPAAEAVGFPLVDDPNKLPFKERVAFNVADYGTQGLGAGALLNRLAQVTRTAAGARPTPTVGDTLLKPYRDRPGVAAAGDTVAGAGAGTALTASQAIPEDTRAAGGGSVGAIADLLAMLAGGTSGGMLANMAADGPAAAARSFTRNMPARDIPLDTEGNPVSRAVADRAGAFMQKEAGGQPRATDAARSIDTARNEFVGEGMPVPSSGLISENVGLENLDRGMRMKNPTPFQESDRRLHGAAMDQVGGVRPAGANPREFTDTVENVATTRRAEAQGDVEHTQQYVNRVGTVRGAQAAEVEGFRGPRQDAAAAQVDRSLVDEGYFPARREKNRQFDEAPGRNEDLPADDLVATAQELRARNNALRPDEQLPTNVVQRLEALAPRMEEVDGQMVNVGGPGTARGGDLADLRMPLADAERRARQSGNFDMADSIGRLRQQINRTIETAPGYADANRNYQQFADTYRPNPGDPMSRFTRELDREPFDRAGVPQRGATPPSQTAGRFIQEGQPEKAAALRRGLDASPTAPQGVRAAGDYITGELANSGAVRNGVLDTARVREWRTRNDSVLNAFPEARAEIDNILNRAQRGDISAEEFGQRLQAAQARARDTERELNSGAFRSVVGKDPEHAVASIFGSGDPVRQMEQARSIVAGNPRAESALKAAVADWLHRKTVDIKPQAVGGGDEALNFARLTKTLRDNEQTLVAAGFTPDEMAALNRAQRLLAPLAKRAGQATVGSPTAENNQMGERLLEVFYKTAYGGLKGGNMMRNTKLLLGMLGGRGTDPALTLVQRAMTDPELASILLTRNVAEAGSPAWNSRLAKHLRRLEAFKQVAPYEQDEE